MNNEQTTNVKRRFARLGFAALTVFVYFFNLNIPLLGPDEPRYSQVAREMFQRNDWVTPTLGGFTWFEKPALLYWLQIVSYKLFGVSEFSARFGSAVFGLLTIFCLYLLGRFLESKQGENTRIAASGWRLSDWLFLVSASSIGLLAFSRGASFDIILTFPLTASLVGFFIFDQSGEKSVVTRYLSLAVFYFFIGVALLAKGLVGIVFPIGIVIFYYLLIRRIPNKTFIISLFWGIILSLATAAVWYVPVYLKNGWTFIDEFFIQHHFARYTSNKYLHPQPFWFFWIVLPLMTLPWLPLFLATIWKFLKAQFSKFKFQSSEKTIIDASPQLKIFAFSWLLVPLVFFSFSGSKLPGYILPSLPAALILTAEYVSGFAENNRKRKIFLLATACAALLLTAIALQFFVRDFARDQTVKSLITAANERGFSDAKILNLHTASHNAEFYGAGRLIREKDGKLKTYYGVSDVAEEIKLEGGRTVLVLVPLEYAGQLSESGFLTAEKIGDNNDLALFAVNLKS